MASLSDNILDNGLQYAVTNGANVYICSTEPTTYTEAVTTYALGNKAGVTLTGPAAGDVNGRKCTIPAISDGSVTSDGTAGFWALTDGVSELLAVQALGATQGVTSGNTWTLPATDITIPDPA